MDKHEAKAGQGWNETNSKSKRVCKLPRSDVGGAMSPGPRTAPQRCRNICVAAEDDRSCNGPCRTNGRNVKTPT